jgi:hypothetical protein
VDLYDLVIIIPGIGGSELWDGDDPVWRGGNTSLIRNLRNPDELAIERVLTPRGLLKDFNMFPWKHIRGYSALWTTVKMLSPMQFPMRAIQAVSISTPKSLRFLTTFASASRQQRNVSLKPWLRGLLISTSADELLESLSWRTRWVALLRESGRPFQDRPNFAGG